ncbi:MAG: YegP family protein [Actinomycetota bacterium]|nr:YegP family protein [Actinomycetota bacterium]
MAERVVIERADGKWGWHLKADNNKIIATDGNQGYENEGDARDMADRIIGGEFKDAEKKISRQPKKK